MGTSHNGSNWGNTNHNFRLAMRRLLGKRCPSRPGYHEALFDNQKSFLRSHKKNFDDLASLYAGEFAEYLGSEVEAVLHAADPHPKMALRVQALEESILDGVFCDPEDPWARKVNWKIKRDEWGKVGKKPRSICDIGPMGSLRGFRITNFLKMAQSAHIYEINGGEAMFCKSPDPFELKEIFENLKDPVGRFFFVYFSDDACLAIRDPVTHEVKRFNLDISSCDASHGPELFQTLIDIMPDAQTREDMELLVAQCQLPLKVVSVTNPRHIVELQPTRPVLYTGSTITTAINNLANLSIAIAISECAFTGSLVNGESLELKNAAERAGYIVTGCEPLELFEDVQFLKNSPVLDTNGQWQPMLNFGVLARASGTCKGDLPGRGPLRPRGLSFQHALLQGCYPRTYCTVVDRMKLAVDPSNNPPSAESIKRVAAEMAWKTVDNPKYPPFRCDEESFCRRYRLDASEYSDLINDYANMTFGEFYAGGSLDKILMKDYGMSTTEENVGEYIAHFVDPVSGSKL